MGAAVAGAFEVPPDKVHLKARWAGKQEGKRYERLARTDQRMAVKEGDLRFYVNLSDYVDTGLFADHRHTRQIVREMAAGKDFLNLYCYTGSFSCYAARGGARTTVSVDRSQTAIDWARENMTLNGIPEDRNMLVQSGSLAYLAQAQKEGFTFDLAVVDPPSYSTAREGKRDFDISRDHPALLSAVIRVLRPGATLFFSTNHQSFDLRTEELHPVRAEEITSHTIPEDYRRKGKSIHRCWRIDL
jgi:23S rRNA (cytosine1962-C5)-methyltransferase